MSPLPQPEIKDQQLADNLNSIDRRIGDVQAAARKRLTAAETSIASLQAPSGCRVYNSGAIATVNNTMKTLTFDSERFDVGGMHSTSSNTSRITFVTAGIYTVTLHAEWANGTANTRRLADILLNGTTVIARNDAHSGAEGYCAHSITTVYRFAANDYIEAVVYQLSGGGLNINATGNYSPEFSAVRHGT